MMKCQNLWILRLVIINCIIIFVVPNVLAKDLSVTPSAISIDYNLGDSQPSDKSITFENSDNTSFSIALTKNGTGTNYYNLSAYTLGFNGTESKTINMNFGISEDAAPDLYSSRIWYGDGDEYIPVFINVKAKSSTSTGCKIILPSELYQISIKKGTNPFTDNFLLKISNKCENGLTITDIRESGQVVQTEQGKQPIRLTGSVPKGDYEKGQTMDMNVEFDVSELSLGDYRSSIVITSTEGDEQITQKIDFRIFVVGTASSVTNETFSTLPTCNPITTDLQIGKTYQLICNNVVDSNIKLNINEESMEYLKGLSSERPTNQIIWSFTPTKLGNAKLKFYFTYEDLLMGEMQEYDLRISQTPSGALGTKLMFDFYPKSLDIDNLKASDTFSVLIKAINPDIVNDTGTIIDNAVLYKDGQQITDNTFTVNSGQKFTLSASAIGFGSIDRYIEVPNQMVSISYPPDVEVGRNVTFVTNPEDALFYIDGIQSSKTYIFTETGSHTIRAEKEGYESNEFSLTVTEQLRLLSEYPKKIKIGDEFVVEYNKPIHWYVSIQEGNNTESLLFTEGNGNYVQFIPDREGIYKIYVRNELIATYELNKFNFGTIIIVVVVVIVIVLLFMAYQRGYFKSSNKEKGEKPKQKAPFEMDFSGFGEER